MHFGYVLDSLTTTRVLSWYKKFTGFCKNWQKFSPFGNTLSLRLGIDTPSLLNNKLIFQNKIMNICTGGGFILALANNGQVYGLGENYKG